MFFDVLKKSFYIVKQFFIILLKIVRYCIKDAFNIINQDADIKKNKKCVQDINNTAHNIVHNVAEVAVNITNNVAQKVSLTVKIFRFFVLIIITFLKILYFVLKLLIYPVTILALLFSIMIVYISISPERHTTQIINNAIHVINVFRNDENQIFIDKIILKNNKQNVGVVNISTNLLQINERFKIENIQLSFNIFQLLTNKSIVFNIINADVYIIQKKKEINTRLDLEIAQIMTMFDFFLKTLLPIKQDFIGDINITLIHDEKIKFDNRRETTYIYTFLIFNILYDCVGIIKKK